MASSLACCRSLLSPFAPARTSCRTPSSPALRLDPTCQLACNGAPPRSQLPPLACTPQHSSGVRAAADGSVGRCPPAAALSSSATLCAGRHQLVGTSRGPCLASRRSRPRGWRIEARGREKGIEPAQRVVAGLAYLLPLLDGIRYGRYLFLQFPFTEVALQPILPLVQLYNSVPFSSLVAFFALYLLVVNNQNYSRYVRFNCYQAILLDILLILPGLVERTFAPTGGVGLEFLILFYNTVFLFIFACFIFGLGSCLLGKEPRLPVVADAADAQVPF